MSDNPNLPENEPETILLNPMPQFSRVMRDIGQMVDHADLVQIRQKCLAGYEKDKTIPAACYGVVARNMIEAGESVDYFMGMRMKRFVKLAKAVQDGF